jgi:hypothetical protein
MSSLVTGREPNLGGVSEEAADTHRLRRTFDAAADRYHRVRPDYPKEVFDDMERLAGL